MNNRELIEIIQDISKKTKTDAYLVGGIVRDKLLGIETKDIDIVIVGSPRAFVEKLKDIFDFQCLHHEKFGTYVFDLKDGTRIDVATARKEVYNHPAALPTVKLGVSLKDDLPRRDFTINAMAIKLDAGCPLQDAGKIIDYYGGLEDLKKGLIRILHKKSFIDDPTRISRAARFACRFDFRIEKNTGKFIKDALISGCVEKLSPARRAKELIALLNEKKSYKIFQLLEQLKVLKVFFPEIDLKKIKNLPPDMRFHNKLKTLLKAVDEPEKFLVKYQFPRKIKFAVI